MDSSDPDVSFDTSGICNHCIAAGRALQAVRLDPAVSQQRLQAIAAKVSRRRTKAGYDSVIGLSGGIDSSYTALLAHRLGLQPLAVHFDNGWNTDAAVSNIRSIVEHCKFDLVTLVIDWREFRDLQRSFMRAGVVDIEMLTDHAIMASMFRLARQYGLRTVLSGTNISTEHGMPRAWVWNKQDLTNILGIHKRFGEVSIKSFPSMGHVENFLFRHASFGWSFVELLDVANFKRLEAIEVLKSTCGWREYGGKHCESIFTKFHQNYILPRKFGIDKRKVHLSALIRNCEISREQALRELAEPLYAADELRRDKSFVLKKLGFENEEFDRIMNQAPVPHYLYPSDKKLRDAVKAITRGLR